LASTLLNLPNFDVTHKFLDKNSEFKKDNPNLDLETVKACEFFKKNSDNKEFLTAHLSSLAANKFVFKLKLY
jgi:hypothetical protein